MVDLTPIVAILQSFGPWGWIAAAAALLLIQMRRNGGKSPTPTPTPANPNAPVPVLPEIDDLLSRLRERLKQRFPNAAPFFATSGTPGASASLADEYRNVCQAIEARRAELATEIRSLPNPPTAGS